MSQIVTYSTGKIVPEIKQLGPVTREKDFLCLKFNSLFRDTVRIYR